MLNSMVSREAVIYKLSFSIVSSTVIAVLFLSLRGAVVVSARGTSRAAAVRTTVCNNAISVALTCPCIKYLLVFLY